MSQPRWDALFGGDPAQIERDVDEWVEGVQQRADRMRELRTEVERIQITETSGNGAVTVTVDANGVPVDIRFTDRASSVAPAELGPLVMGCLRAAQSRIAGRVSQAAATTVGTDLPETRQMLVDSYRQRFGDAAPEAPEAPATRRRPPPRNGDDFADDSYLT
jgi:DNA-binding protein YbaB